MGAPDKLYKFLKKEHADTMMSRGSVAIGTAVKFREPDGKEGGRADKNEIAAVWKPPAGTMTIGLNDPFPFLSPPQEFQMHFGEGVEFHFVPNAYLYCTSLEVTHEIKKRMLDDFGADACIQIDNPATFIEQLRLHSPLQPKSSWYGPVMYEEAEPQSKFTSLNPLVKAPKFDWQKEFRIVWDADPADEPIVVDIPEIAGNLIRLY
jgi:hypothetical protein